MYLSTGYSDFDLGLEEEKKKNEYLMKRKEWIRLVIDVIWKVLTALSTFHWVCILIFSGVLTMLSFLLKTNPFFGIVFGISLAIVAFAIIAIIVHIKEKKREGEELERKIQLQNGLEIRQVRHRGEPQIRIYQRFANACDFNVKITKIESILRDEEDAIIDEYTYNESNLTFKDEQKLIFPKDIAPLSLNEKLEYRTTGEEKLEKLKHPGYLKQVIEFSTRTATISKTANKIVLSHKSFEGINE